MRRKVPTLKTKVENTIVTIHEIIEKHLAKSTKVVLLELKRLIQAGLPVVHQTPKAKIYGIYLVKN